MMRFLSGAGILVLALALQFQFSSLGAHITLALGVIIALAVSFDLWELLVYDLLALLLLNWEPAPSFGIAAFFVIPLGVSVSKQFLAWQPWTRTLIATIIGFFIFYLAARPTFSLGSIFQFTMDLIIGVLVAELTLFATA